VTGRVTLVGSLIGFDHSAVRDGWDANGEWKPEEYDVPGVDTEVHLSGHPFTYRVRAVPTPDGPRVVELHIDSAEHDVPITPADLRSLARYLGRLAYVAAANADEALAMLDPKRFGEPEKPLPKRPGPKGNPDSHYAAIAAFAKQVHQCRDKTGVSARAAIADHYSVTTECADKWLAGARKRGYLKSGELGGKPKPRKQPSANKREDQ